MQQELCLVDTWGVPWAQGTMQDLDFNLGEDGPPYEG